MQIIDSPVARDQLTASEFFGDLDGADTATIAGYLQQAGFAAGDRIFGEGDEGTFACFILDGQVDVTKLNDVEEPILISILGRGRAIGEMALIDQAPRSASVVARSAGTLLLLHRDRFEALLAAEPRIGVHLLRRIARMVCMNLRKTSAAVAELLS